MNKESLKVINDINRAIIKARGIYSEWSARHGISYHEMLVIYTIREFGFCTQKQICDILRYPSDKSELTGIIYEPWHYRYVGKEAAKEIYEQGVCLEEYLSAS